MSCDWILAADTAVFGQPEEKLGSWVSQPAADSLGRSPRTLGCPNEPKVNINLHPRERISTRARGMDGNFICESDMHSHAPDEVS